MEVIPPDSIKEYVDKFVDAILKNRMELPRQIDLKTIVTSMNIDAPLAIAIKGYIDTHKEELISILAQKLAPQIEGDIFELERKLKIDIYWIAKIAKSSKKYEQYCKK